MSVAATASASTASVCQHCGLPLDREAIQTGAGGFCCSGCEAVYTILHAAGLDAYYQCEVPPGPTRRESGSLPADRFAALDDPDVAARVVEFDDGRRAVAAFEVPALHCASCVWLLEQFWRFDAGAGRSEVDLQRRVVTIEYRPEETTPRRLAERLAALGYEPAVPLERTPAAPPAARRRLLLQIGVAGFAFGNSMLFSIPGYVNGRPLEGGLQHVFDALNLGLAVPVLVFSASGWFRTAWQAVRARTLALELPVALGLSVLFVRSAAEILAGRGPGFLDSFTGLVFFLLIGRLFQERVFDRIAFDRRYRSFLPLAVRVEQGSQCRSVPIERLAPGDVVVLSPHEVAPADGRLLDERAAVDYRFLTGEDRPVEVVRGETVRAGGRAVSAMRLCVAREASRSQLARLWANPAFDRPRRRWLTEVAARFGGVFTLAAVGLAAAGAIAWWPDASASASVATAVLIVACPCALTLAAPVTLGTGMAALGRSGCYVRQPAVLLDLSRVDTLVFDKTGTLTAGRAWEVVEAGGLTDDAWVRVRRLARESVHPVSRAIAASGPGDHRALASPRAARPDAVSETPGQGIAGTVDGVPVAIGTASFIAARTRRPAGPADRTYVSHGDRVGWVRLRGAPRPGIEAAAGALAPGHALWLLSGDHGADEARWAGLFGTRMRFRQSPEDKLAYVDRLRRAGHRVLMVGDGLNDAGAFAAADVGMAVSDDTACLVPACDAVIGGDRLTALPQVLRFARRARALIVACFLVSVVYNAAGLTLALSGRLTPLASAILMPVSSLTVIALGAGGMRCAARRLLP
jgi:Cu+-exporting ATPase